MPIINTCYLCEKTIPKNHSEKANNFTLNQEQRKEMEEEEEIVEKEFHNTIT
jgi:hypothetical protein